MDVNILGAFNSTSYGAACINFIKSLDELGCRIAFKPLTTEEYVVQQHPELWQRIMKNCEMPNFKAPCLKIWHQWLLFESLGNGPRVAMTFFESDTFRPQEIHHLSNQDHLIVASTFGKRVIEGNGISTPVSVVPLGIDTDIFSAQNNWDRDEIRSKLGVKDDEFLFFTGGKNEYRKTHDLIPQMYSNAFSKNEKVRFLYATYNHCRSLEDNAAWFRQFEADPRAVVMKQRLATQVDLAKLIFASDCVFMPSRAEGWNMVLCEALAMDKPVISTANSAHVDFCRGPHTYLVDTPEQEECYDGVFFFGIGNWAKITEKVQENLIDRMRYVYHNDIRINPNDVKKEYTWQKCAQKLITTLKSVA